MIKYLEEKERILQEQKNSILPIIKNLKLIEKPRKEQYSMEIFSGKEGFKSLLEDILKENKNYRMIGYMNVGINLLGHYFTNWHKRRVKQKIKREIVAKKDKKQNIEKFKELTITKYLPENYEIPTSVIIYGNKTILFLPLEDDIAAIKIDSEKITKSFNTYFELLWKLSA